MNIGHMDNTNTAAASYPTIVDELWTSKQRQASPLHEISYRACFKPQLPRYFIERFSAPGDVVYDPFTGRGTTIIEAAMIGRRVVSNDVNPISRILTEPRLLLPSVDEIIDRLDAIPIAHGASSGSDLSMFFHPRTEAGLVALRQYLIDRRAAGSDDAADAWIRMVATNRLTGHSPGFFSVYTLPPNQATSRERQVLINTKRQQAPEYRDIKLLIIKKSKQLLKDISPSLRQSMRTIGEQAVFIRGDARATSVIPDESVQITVTSPPFLDIVQYSSDNWLRCWFNNIDDREIGKAITMSRTVEEWSEVMSGVMAELFRITRPGGHVAFEVGEVRKGTIKLDDAVIPMGTSAGFTCQALYINEQQFSKTSNIWGIRNNNHGTNTNRIVLFHKAPGPRRQRPCL
jgi:hypothetical protein